MIFRLTSKKPVLIAGNGVRTAGAVELLHEFAKKTDIPVLTTMNAVDLTQDDMKLGFIGEYGNRIANMILEECDLVISIGARLNLRQVGRNSEKFAPGAVLLRNDADEHELQRTIKANEEKYCMDAGDFLKELLQEEIPKYTEWRQKCICAKQDLGVSDHTVGNDCMEAIASLLPLNPIVAVDVGQNQCWAAQSLTLHGGNGRMFIGGGYGSMGCALPYAIGASIASGNGPVFCLTGDGGFQMNIQELQTVVREQLPIKILVINNYSLGKISEQQRNEYEGRYAQTTSDSGYTVPDFVRIADAYGIRSAEIVSFRELNELRSWLYDDQPCLINISLPKDTELLPKMDWNIGKDRPLLAIEPFQK